MTDCPKRNLSPGGSTGGEGALLGIRGSILGIGTDVGGSIRIPATYNGIYGLRPSYNRIPHNGTPSLPDGQGMMPAVMGPMSATIDGLKVFVKAMMDANPWDRDPLTPRIPWNEGKYLLEDHGKGERLCFGMMWDDGVCKPQPPILRAMEETKQALLAAGHEGKSSESFGILIRG